MSGKPEVHLLGYLRDWTVELRDDFDAGYLGDCTGEEGKQPVVITARYEVPPEAANAVHRLIEARANSKQEMSLIDAALDLAKEAGEEMGSWRELARQVEAACAWLRASLVAAARMCESDVPLEGVAEFLRGVLGKTNAGEDFLRRHRELREAVDERKVEVASQLLAGMNEGYLGDDGL